MSKTLNLLVVEDDLVDVKAVQRILGASSMPYRTDNAQTLKQAKQKARQQRYDAVLLDLGLPDSQGIDGLIEFQASAPELPVVVLTGSRDEEMALHSMDVGAEDFLSKESLSEHELSRSLRFAIQRHRRKHQAYGDQEAPSTENYFHFDHVQEAWSLAQPMAERPYQSQRLVEMTLHCLRLAQQWRQSQALGLEVRQNVEAEAVLPWVCAELAHIFPSLGERADCAFFLPMNFSSPSSAGSSAALHLLRQAGFRIGLRDVGDGRTILETLLALVPDWIRLDPALTDGTDRSEKRAEALRKWTDVLRLLGAQMGAKRAEGEAAPGPLQDLGFEAYYGRE
jgi:DNA-binding response OmpR family regulator